MSGMVIVFATLAAMVAAFLSSRVPVALAALGAVLVLYFTGTLDLRTALSGFGDPTVLFIVSASLEASGVTAWVGQGLIRFGNDNATRVTVLTTLLAGALTALLGVSGAVSALLPVVMLVAVRLRRPPSTLLMPLVYSAHAGSMLVLTASLVNVVASDAAQEIGLAEFGYFELSVIGVPLFAGTILIIVLLGHRLLPERTGRALPPDLSGHSKMLADQYRLLEDTFRLEVQPGSSLIGTSKAALKSRNQPGLSVIAIQPAP
jgi:Na+/H+ antiporter NhaD/arsenite permease-like protein